MLYLGCGKYLTISKTKCCFHRRGDKMTNIQTHSALDGRVVINGDTVSVVNDEGSSVEVSLAEWETLKEDFRFDDTVDYEKGETPMTVFQFNSCVEIFRKLKNLELENVKLIAEIGR